MNYSGYVVKWKLDGHVPIPCSDVREWASWYETADDERLVARSEPIPGVRVQTDFTGLNYAMRDGSPPMLFETMVFGGAWEGTTWRCSTWEEAEEQHRRVVGGIRQFPDKSVLFIPAEFNQ